MDPLDPDSFNHRTAQLSTGRKYHFIDQIPKNYSPSSTPTLLCVHGFPDIWYGWRYCIPPWVEKCGWRVVVPDMLGYGGTDKPHDPAHYSTKALSADLAGLLDFLGIPKVIILGHDWGCATTWRFALWHPDRVRAVVGLSIPFTPTPKEYLSLEEVVKRQPRFDYQLYFDTPSTTKEIEGILPQFISVSYQVPKQSTSLLQKIWEIPQTETSNAVGSEAGSLLSGKEFDYYLMNFRAGGMNGPLNYYRTTKHRFDEEAGVLPDRLPASLPVLFLWGDRDATCSPTQVKRMEKLVPSLKSMMLLGKGHWLMLEAPEHVVKNVAAFVQDLISKESAKL